MLNGYNVESIVGYNIYNQQNINLFRIFIILWVYFLLSVSSRRASIPSDEAGILGSTTTLLSTESDSELFSIFDNMKFTVP